MGEEYLQKISNILNQKYTEQFVIITKSSNHTQRFKEPIILDKERNYTVSLVFFTAYNVIKNITDQNNSFHYFQDSEWKTIKLREGSYEIHNLSDEIQRKTGLDKSIFDISAIQYLNRAELKIGTVEDETIEVKFDNTSFGKLLGFDDGTYTATTPDGYQLDGFYRITAQNRADINSISTINIKTNLIDGGYINGKRNNILHTIPTFTVPVGYKIIERPYYPTKPPLVPREIHQITIEIVDEDGQPINFSDEEITIKLVIEQV